MPDKLTKEKIQGLSGALDAICKLVEVYKRNAFEKDGDKTTSEIYGQSTKKLFLTKQIRDPHAALVGYAGSLIYGLNEIIDSSDFSTQALENADVTHCSDMTVYILKHFLSNEDKNILNKIDSKFDELANKSLILIQEVKSLIVEEQKKIAESKEQNIDSNIFNKKSNPTIFTQITQKPSKIEEEKQPSPKSHLIGPKNQ